MALAERATGSGVEAGGAASPVAVTLSAAPVAGDLILVFVNFNNNSDGVHPVPTFTGASSLGTSTASGWSRLTCLGKIAAGTEGTSLSVTWSGSGDSVAVAALVVSGADSSLPTNIITTPDASSDTTVNIAAITTAAANSWDVVGVCFGGNNDYNTTGTNYSAWGSSLVEKIDVAAGSGGFEYAGIGMAYVLRATAAVQAATSVTQSIPDVAGVIRLEVKQAVAGGGVTVDLTTAPATASGTAVSPSVRQGSLTLTLTASPASSAGTAVSPTVRQGSLTLTLTSLPATAASSAISPSVRQSSLTVNLSAVQASAVGTAVTPTVTVSGGGTTVNVSGAPASASGTAVSPSVRQGSVTVDVGAAAASSVGTAISPSVRQSSLSLNLAALPASATGTAVSPSVVLVEAFDFPLSALSVVARPGASSSAGRPGASSSARRAGATSTATRPGATSLATRPASTSEL